MSFKTFFTLHAITVAYFGLGSLFLPELMWGRLYGLPLNAATLWALRSAGFLICGNVVLSWLMRDVTDQKAREAFCTALLFEWAVYIILALMGQLDGLFNLLNWSNLAVAAIWVAAFTYFRFIRQPQAAA